MSLHIECTPRVTRGFVEDCMSIGVVPFIKGPPGIGKSGIIADIAQDNNLELIDLRAITRNPIDFGGMPTVVDGDAKFLPFKDMIPTFNCKIPEGKNGWLLFLDEVNQASKSVQAALFQVILDKKVGSVPIHPNVFIVAAGNRDIDRAITTPMSTAMQSRMAHITMHCDFGEWKQDIAIKYGYHEWILGFLNMYPEYLFDFKPDFKGDTFCSPRTWSFVNRLVWRIEELTKGLPISEKIKALSNRSLLINGMITAGIGSSFVQYASNMGAITKISDIIKDPETANLPLTNELRWGTISHMTMHMTNDNIAKLGMFANRFPMDFRILFYQAMIQKNPSFRRHEVFIKGTCDLAKYLHG